MKEQLKNSTLWFQHQLLMIWLDKLFGRLQRFFRNSSLKIHKLLKVKTLWSWEVGQGWLGWLHLSLQVKRYWLTIWNKWSSWCERTFQLLLQVKDDCFIPSLIGSRQTLMSYRSMSVRKWTMKKRNRWSLKMKPIEQMRMWKIFVV